MPLEGGNGSLAALQWALCSEGSSSKSSRGPKGGICGKAIPGEVPVSMDRDMLGDRIPTGKSPADVLLEAAQKCVDALDISIPQHMYKKVLKLKKAIAAKKDWDVRLRASFKKAMESPDVSDSLEQCFGVE